MQPPDLADHRLDLLAWLRVGQLRRLQKRAHCGMWGRAKGLLHENLHAEEWQSIVGDKQCAQPRNHGRRPPDGF